MIIHSRETHVSCLIKEEQCISCVHHAPLHHRPLAWEPCQCGFHKCFSRITTSQHVHTSVIEVLKLVLEVPDVIVPVYDRAGLAAGLRWRTALQLPAHRHQNSRDPDKSHVVLILEKPNGMDHITKSSQWLQMLYGGCSSFIAVQSSAKSAHRTGRAAAAAGAGGRSGCAAAEGRGRCATPAGPGGALLHGPCRRCRCCCCCCCCCCACPDRTAAASRCCCCCCCCCCC